MFLCADCECAFLEMLLMTMDNLSLHGCTQVVFEMKLTNCNDYCNYIYTHTHNYHDEEQGELKTNGTYFYILHGGLLVKKKHNKAFD